MTITVFHMNCSLIKTWTSADVFLIYWYFIQYYDIDINLIFFASFSLIVNLRLDSDPGEEEIIQAPDPSPTVDVLSWLSTNESTASLVLPHISLKQFVQKKELLSRFLHLFLLN